PETGAEENNQMCSFNSDEMEDMCYFRQDEACGDRLLSTKGEYVEILEFTHFARVFKFTGKSNFGRKKEISNEIKVSVVIELV
ncbi:MAG: hypothetical protein ACRC9L_03045, partial [Brevinema sp.]